MKNYIGSEEHKKNALLAGKKGKLQIKKNKQARIDLYDIDPKKCNWCNNKLDYYSRKKKYCNSHCAACANNTGTKQTDETKKKISNKLRGIAFTEERRKNNMKQI